MSDRQTELLNRDVRVALGIGLLESDVLSTFCKPDRSFSDAITLLVKVGRANGAFASRAF